MITAMIFLYSSIQASTVYTLLLSVAGKTSWKCPKRISGTSKDLGQYKGSAEPVDANKKRKENVKKWIKVKTWEPREVLTIRVTVTAVGKCQPASSSPTATWSVSTSTHMYTHTHSLITISYLSEHTHRTNHWGRKGSRRGLPESISKKKKRESQKQPNWFGQYSHWKVNAVFFGPVTYLIGPTEPSQ